MGLIAVFIGGAIALLGIVLLTINAFSSGGAMWGIGCACSLLFSIVAKLSGKQELWIVVILVQCIPLLFGILHWKEVKASFLAWIIGSLIVGGGLSYDAYESKAELKREQIEKLESEIKELKETRKSKYPKYSLDYVDERIEEDEKELEKAKKE